MDKTSLRDSPATVTPQEVGVSPVGGVTKMEVEVKAEVKEEDGRKSTESRPPSGKLTNGDTGQGETGLVKAFLFYCICFSFENRFIL